MPLLKNFSKSSEKEVRPVYAQDHSPPPAYTAHAPENETAPDITAAMSHLNLQGSVKPTVDQCIAHLKLLEAFNSLREDVATTDGLFGIQDDWASGDVKREQAESLAQIREKRWAVYVAKAADRFAKWWQFCVETNAQKLELNKIPVLFKESPHRGAILSFDKNSLPPLGMYLIHIIKIDRLLRILDVIMVWHAYQLNPRDFLEDCLRHGKMNFWRNGLPWSAINSCIDNDTFEFRAGSDAAESFRTKTGHQWNSLDDRETAVLQCPLCMKPTPVPWTTWNSPSMWRKGSRGTLEGEHSAVGFADMAFRATCINCKCDIRHDDLKMMKFRKDMLALYKDDVPMPGTILSIDGG